MRRGDCAIRPKLENYFVGGDIMDKVFWFSHAHACGRIELNGVCRGLSAR